MDVAVCCKSIKKVFGTGAVCVEALRGIDLEVYQGELLLLMGPSGSGKTTLISILAGILTQTEGQVLIYGQDLNHLPEEEKAGFRGKWIGFVFQSFNLIPMLQVKENVAIPLVLNGTQRQEAEERAEDILKEFGIGDKAKKFPGELSGGQQQRVAIARAIIHNPDLIVCDEPTSSLDFETGSKVMELLKKIVVEKKKTVIVVSHDPRVMKFADRIVQIEDGHCKSVERMS